MLNVNLLNSTRIAPSVLPAQPLVQPQTLSQPSAFQMAPQAALLSALPASATLISPNSVFANTLAYVGGRDEVTYASSGSAADAWALPIFFGGIVLCFGASVALSKAKERARRLLHAEASDLYELDRRCDYEHSFRYGGDVVSSSIRNVLEQPSVLRFKKHAAWMEGIRKLTREKREEAAQGLSTGIREEQGKLKAEMRAYDDRLEAVRAIFGDIHATPAQTQFTAIKLLDDDALKQGSLVALYEHLHAVRGEHATVKRSFDWLADYQELAGLQTRVANFVESDTAKNMPNDILADVMGASSELDEKFKELQLCVSGKLSKKSDLVCDRSCIPQALNWYRDELYLGNVVDLWSKHCADLFIMRPKDVPDPLALQGIMRYVALTGDDGREMVVGYKGEPILNDEGKDVTFELMVKGFSPYLENYHSMGFMAVHGGKLYLDNAVPNLNEDDRAMLEEEGAKRSVAFLRHLGYDPRIFRVGSNVREMLTSGK